MRLERSRRAGLMVRAEGETEPRSGESEDLFCLLREKRKTLHQAERGERET